MFERISAYIVNKRKAFMVFFILAAVFSVFSSSWVKVSNKLSDYLPESTKTKQGLDIMDENFTTFGTAKVMVNNIDYEKALELSTKLKEIAGVSRVDFYDKSDSDYENKNIEDYYKDFAALYTISFEDVEDSKLVQEAIVKVREAVSTYDNVVYTTIDNYNCGSTDIYLTDLCGNTYIYADLCSGNTVKCRNKLYIRSHIIRNQGGRSGAAIGTCHRLCHNTLSQIYGRKTKFQGKARFD